MEPFEYKQPLEQLPLLGVLVGDVSLRGGGLAGWLCCCRRILGSALVPGPWCGAAVGHHPGITRGMSVCLPRALLPCRTGLTLLELRGLGAVPGLALLDSHDRLDPRTVMTARSRSWAAHGCALHPPLGLAKASASV